MNYSKFNTEFNNLGQQNGLLKCEDKPGFDD